MATGGGEILRVGCGKECSVVRRGPLELVALGSRPVAPRAWWLLFDLLEREHRIPVDAGMTRSESTVRIDGSSAAADRLRSEVDRAAASGLGVLVEGETGTGKDVVARELHRLSERPGEFTAVNIAAVPANLLEAELFGSVRGAFTGADRSRRGLVRTANGGTLLLDEVGDLDGALQVKLLRFLESGEVRPVGADRSEAVDVRVVCATHRNLERRVREGAFREDLFYRIAVVRIAVPPLRERIEDIGALREVFERSAARRLGITPPRWSSAALQRLARHRWPGNVRELRHAVEVAILRAGEGPVKPEHLPFAARPAAIRGTWETVLDEHKRRLLADVLGRHRGNRSAAARELGISRQALLYQLKRLDLRDL
jgi:DNA-binding NtrC family response regulator